MRLVLPAAPRARRLVPDEEPRAAEEVLAGSPWRRVAWRRGTKGTLAAANSAGLVRLPQGQIAPLVAASRPKVNAALAEFRARGLVAPCRAGLKLVDPAGLRALAEQVHA